MAAEESSSTSDLDDHISMSPRQEAYAKDDIAPAMFGYTTGYCYPCTKPRYVRLIKTAFEAFGVELVYNRSPRWDDDPSRLRGQT